MKTYIYESLSTSKITALTKRPSIQIEKTIKQVKPILENIKLNKLKDVLKYAAKFDRFQGREICVSKKEFDEAEKILHKEVKKALQTAATNIKLFHEKQAPNSYKVETMPGVVCSREFRAIENVGLYVPGGTAVLPSTMLMLGLPAAIAGCNRIIACSPAKNGMINPALLYAAKIVGVEEFYKIGGAHSIAMMAYGCNKINKVDKIFGPGNQYVTAAKILVSIDPDGCAIDMPAGPSEVLIIADENANASYIAADMLSQAEHGKDSQTIFISNSLALTKNVKKELKQQLNVLTRREIAEESLNNSFTLIVNELNQAFDFSNKYAPEHLILHLKNADEYKEIVINAGSVFIGSNSPESVGDYASGTNHSLPTYGYAKSFGGVSVEMFMKGITFQKLTKEGLKNISETVITLAETESLQAHANAVKIRLRK